MRSFTTHSLPSHKKKTAVPMAWHCGPFYQGEEIIIGERENYYVLRPFFRAFVLSMFKVYPAKLKPT